MATMMSSAEETKPGNILRKFPREIREEIFKLTVGDWENKMPALIKALRGDREVYLEAMKVFYKINKFFSSRKNNWGEEFPDHLLPIVTRWKIEFTLHSLTTDLTRQS
jgi:hypothetical protein